MGAQEVDALHSPVQGPDVEREIALDLIKHGAYAAPLVLVAGAVVAGWSGVLGAAIALGVVVANFWLGASLLTWAARISVNALLVVSVVGFFVRLGLITLVGLAVRSLAAVDFAVFGIVLIVTHLGLLFWEMRRVSLTLAYPGLKPGKE